MMYTHFNVVGTEAQTGKVTMSRPNSKLVELG